MNEYTVPLTCDDAGAMYARADHVSGMLRLVANQWCGYVDDGLTDLDPETIEALAESLIGVADQIDLACIAQRTAQQNSGDTGTSR